MMLRRQKEIFPSQLSLEVFLQTYLEHVQKYQSKFLQADSVVQVVSSRLSLLFSAAQCWSSKLRLASLAE